ncbi:DUF3291 domain-containing protein [Rhizobiales bacterium Sp-1]|uniref:DUF3291 domain-containing protein n=1 Tax=Segnochrobactrum spirostomi TaxID=2608987 RepID=A0A6A7Y0U9_9HYPH|nr:DUF3291 domain-containing protein [Segnochrobactrum spirostomi]
MASAGSTAAASAGTAVSVTRFRLRTLLFAPSFFLHAHRTIVQIRKADGFVAGAVLRDAHFAFWTLTLWRDDAAMRTYATSGAHRRAMPRLAEWADEASVAHWRQAGARLPDWTEAARRLRAEGRPLPLRHPAPSHANHGFAAPATTRGMRI